MTSPKKPQIKKSPLKKTSKKKTAASKSTTATKAVKKKRMVKKAASLSAAKTNGPLCIVGIGASAGGLEALEGFFSAMPDDNNMAFVVVQHLPPDRKSIMDSLLKRYTGMNIMHVQDGIRVRPNHIYLNPPDMDVSIMNSTLYLIKPMETHAVRLPIDQFFRSLAEDQREKAVCIICSGTGSDGTLGMKAVKGEGGITFVQDEKQAKYDSMPRNAINTGLVDFILPVEQMPGELLGYVRHPYMGGPEKAVTKPEHIKATNKILLLVRSQTGHDFSNYMQNTIRRRIERRMAVHKIDRIQDYLRYVQENPGEGNILCKDMLITVTNFFRDPESFEVLAKKVMPSLMANKAPDSDLRVWVAGCATGEEVYSIAMIIREIMDNKKMRFNVQIFATDIDDEAVTFARMGVYPESIAADVSPARLERFFTKAENTYTVKKQLREMVVFAVHNLIKDPPFSRLDMVSCRNVLIYMNSYLQKKIMPLFHYILNSDGVMFLGTSESIGGFADFFVPVSAKWKIFRHKGATLDKIVHPNLPFHETDAVIQRAKEKRIAGDVEIRQVAEKLILQEYSPTCVLVNGSHEIIYFHGKTDLYLTPPVGDPTFNILKMARPDLRYALSSLLQKAVSRNTTAVSKGVSFKHGRTARTVDLAVKPLTDDVAAQGLTMIIFEDRTLPEGPLEKKKKTARKVKKEAPPRIIALEQELLSTKEYLQTIIEELETSNEELQSTNEELQSTNEELQSTNEEMETSREELQSTNEELETVNSELTSRVEELSHVNNDLNNFLSSTDIGTIFLDIDLKISRFTPSMTGIFNLIQADIGRPISDITSKVLYKGIMEDSKRVLDTLATHDEEIQTIDGGWFNMKIMPYRTVDNVIDGVVITFVDITEFKKAQLEIRKAKEFAESIVDTVREPLIVLDPQMNVISANKSFYRTFQVAREDTESRSVYELGKRQWNIPSLRKLLEEILPKKNTFQDYIVEHEFPSLGKKKMILNARKLFQGEGEGGMILLAIEDITGRRDRETE